MYNDENSNIGNMSCETESMMDSSLSVDIPGLPYVLRKDDKNYFRYRVKLDSIAPDGKYHKHWTIHNYGSGGLGSKVRNAVTGFTYDILVGSRNEDVLFKVIDSTGNNRRRDPLMLYYDSPEQYEKHHLTEVSQETKDRWYKRYLKYVGQQ